MGVKGGFQKPSVVITYLDVGAVSNFISSEIRLIEMKKNLLLLKSEKG